MQTFYIFIYLLILALIQTILSFEVINNEQDETNFDNVLQIPSLSSDFISNDKQGNVPECLSKNLFLNMLSRNRRASISRPYFHHWRGSRDNSRYGSKNLLPFSPRLGKRAYEDENESDIDMNIKRQTQEENNGSQNLDAFLLTFVDYLRKTKIDIIYEDSTKICLSQAVSDASIKEIFEKFDNNRRQQEMRERNSKSKHPLLFRYRLG